MKRWMVGVAAGFLLGACDDVATGPGQRVEPRELTSQEASVVEAGNSFTFDLLRLLAKAEPEANLFLSPISASMVIGMAMNGADGETRAEMEQAVGLARLELDEVNQAYRGLIDLLPGLDPAVQVQIANSIWYRDGFAVLPEFLRVNRETFDAEVAGLDFGSPAALETINGWVEEATKGKIPTIIDEIRADHVMFLINALYFKGLWEYPFDPENTREAPFHRPDGSTVQIPLMTRDSLFLHAATERYQAIELAYGGGAFAMTVVLPPEGVSTTALAAELDEDAWGELVGSLAPERVLVSLPRFKLDDEHMLNEVLEALGMRLAFTGAADFSRLTPGGGVWIDYIKQKAIVEVDEKGTEAAAVTVGAIATSMPPEFRADRPFLFAIRERTSGTILFIGRVTDPRD